MIEPIRTALINLINDHSEKIEAAYRNAPSQIDGYPAAIITPTKYEGSYHQTSPRSNKEFFSFKIELIYPFTEGQETADVALDAAVDEFIEILRDRTALGAAADWVEPVASIDYGYQDRPAGTMRVAEIMVRAVKYTDPSES